MLGRQRKKAQIRARCAFAGDGYARLANAIDEGILDILIAEFLSAEAHAVCVSGACEVTSECLDERIFHPS